MKIKSPAQIRALLFLLFIVFFVGFIITREATPGQAQQRRKTAQKSDGGAARLVDEANKLADDNKWREAIEAYKSAIRLDPKYAPAYEGLGDAYLNTSKWEEALGAYKEAVRLAPNDPVAQYDLGYCYNTMGRHGEAFAPLVKAMNLDPQFAEAYYGIGYAYLKGNDFEKSISFFKSAIRLKPVYADAYYGLGQVYARLGKTDLAQEQLRKLATLDPKLARKLEQEMQAPPANSVETANAKPAIQLAPSATQPTPAPAQTAQSEAKPSPQSQRAEEAAQKQTTAANETGPVLNPSPAPSVNLNTQPSVSAPSQPSPQTEQPTSKTQSVAGNDSSRQLQHLDEPAQKPAETASTQTSNQTGDSGDQVKSLPIKTKRWALVIGVDKYVDPQISPLHGAANDARLLADALIRYGGFPQDQVIVLSTDQPIERQPTRVNVLRRLSNLASAAPKDGLLLVSFAGHGMERGGQAFLLPSDAQISDSLSFLEDTALSVNRMKDLIKNTGVGQVMILLDACRNDPGGRAEAPNPLTEAYMRGFNFDVRNREVQAFATIYATAIGQRAYEYTEKKQGYFTWAIVEGLKGGAANQNGEVTLSQLVKFVQETVPKRIAIDLGSGKQQRPFANVEGYRADDLVVALSGPGAASAGPSGYAPSTAVDPAAIELAYWDAIKNSTNPEDFKAYLQKYPDGQFADLAKLRAQPAKSSPNPNSVDANSLEMTYWNAIKDSRNPADFKTYITKFPNGLFVELANSRINFLESEARDRERSRMASEANERARNTHIFDVLDGSRTAGTLTVTPGAVSFEPKKREKNDRKTMTVQCSEIKRVERGQSAFAQPHINIIVAGGKGKDREILFYTSSGGPGFFVNKPVVDITADVLNAIIQDCRMIPLNK
jgi:tetratricopeptide (TPR) repeat protein